MSQKDEQQDIQQEVAVSMDPVRKWTFIILALVALLLVWHLIADRLTPYTSQARVHALVVPVAAQVSGKVISVAVRNNQSVEAGQELFRIDPDSYQLAVQNAEATLASVKAKFQQSKRDAERLTRIRKQDPGAISARRVESARASFEAALGQMVSAKTNLENALLNLERTTIKAPEAGVVTDVRINNGGFAAAGSPQMTFIALQNIWIQADFTENNLGNIRPGDEVRIVFDAQPGDVFTGSVRELGFGVAVDSAPTGTLPTIKNDRNWLRDAQRFPVLVDFPIPMEQGRTNLRVGSQASLTVLTGDHPLLNALAKLEIWLVSIFTYAY